MPMIRCSANEHYYDNSKHSKCPFCTSGRGDDEKTSMVGPRDDNDKTRVVDVAPMPEQKIEKEETPEMKQQDPKTTAPWQRKRTKEQKDSAETLTQKTESSFSDAPVVGWLVVKEGNNQGRDFRIIPGINAVGRDVGNTICIDTGDHEISRERHCIIEFDVKNSKFYLERGSTTTYLNDSRVGGDGSELVIGDIIELGATKMQFVPFCSADFCWEM